MDFVKNLIVDKIEEKVGIDLDDDGDIAGKKTGNQHTTHSSAVPASSAPSSYLAAAQGAVDHDAAPPSAPHSHFVSSSAASSSATRTDTSPSSEELSSLRLACQAIWDLDENRLQPNKEYELNLQGGKTSTWDKDDDAHHSLFSRLDMSAVKRIATYRSFIELLDNYERSTGATETVTQEEKAENNEFLSAVLRTPVGKYLSSYLVAKGIVRSPGDVHQYLYRLWFYLYRREAHRDSSGFEHVFVGEERDGNVSGFHNWLQFYLEEKKGAVNYKGVFIPRRGGRDELDARFLCIFLVEDDDNVAAPLRSGVARQCVDGKQEGKSVSTMFVGTSPEFELALYTICFVGGSEENHVSLGGYDLTIKCFRIAGDKIGTSFPIL